MNAAQITPQLLLHTIILALMRPFMETPAEGASGLTDQQKQLNAFFMKEPFGCNNENVANLVGLMTGHRPTTATATAKNGQVYMRKGVPWVVICENRYGFINLESGYNEYHASKDVLATPDEAKAFFAIIEKTDPTLLTLWIRKHIGGDHVLNLLGLKPS